MVQSHVGEGQWSLRSRAHPLGLTTADSDRVLRSNQVLEIASWVRYVTLRSKRFTYLLLMMPEDFGGHRLSGPASFWNLEEFRSLHGINRGAAFFCRFAAAEQKHPVGVVTTSLPFSMNFTWAGRNYLILATISLVSVPFFGIAHVLSPTSRCVGLLAVRSILLLLTLFCCFFCTLVFWHWRSLQPSLPQGWGAFACFGFFDFYVLFVGVFKLFSVVLCGQFASSAFPVLVFALSRSLIKDFSSADHLDQFSLLGSERTIGHVSLFLQLSVQQLHFVVFRLCSFAFLWLFAFGIVDTFFSFAAGPLALSAKCEKTPGLSEVEE